MSTFLLLLIGICPRPDIDGAKQTAEQCICDLSFGARQLEQFICDRAGTAGVIKRNPVLRFMLIWYFAGELKGHRVYWDHREPTSGRPAEHQAPYESCPCLVLVSKDIGISAVDKCVMLLFELHNRQRDEAFTSLVLSASKRRISREDYAMSCVRLEFEAMGKTQLFLLNNPIVGADARRDELYALAVLARGDFSDYVSWLEGLDDKEYNPLKYYGRGYDAMERVNEKK